MNLIELRDKIDKEIEQGLGYIPVLALNADSMYENSTDIIFDNKDYGYVIY